MIPSPRAAGIQVPIAAPLGVLTGANVLVLLLMQWYILVTLGPGLETDALFAGNAVPQFVLSVVSGSLVHVLVPLLAAEHEESFARDAWGFAILIGGLFVAFTFCLYAFAAFWVPLLVPGFSEPGKLLAIRLTRIQLLGMVFTALSGVLLAAYHARQRFIWVELSSLLTTVSGLGLLLWALPRYGVFAAAWVGVVRVAVQTLLLGPALGGYRKPDWERPSFGRAWRRLKPLLFGTTYYKTDSLMDRFLASMVPPGGLSLLYVGHQIYGAAAQIVGKAIAAPMVPLLAGRANAGDFPMFKHIYHRRLAWMAGVTGVGYGVLVFLGKPVVELFIGHGGVTKENVQQLWQIILALAGVFIGGLIGQILASAFYAKGNTTTPARVGVLGFTLGIGLKVAGFFQFGLLGIAAGTSAYYVVNACALYVLLGRELQGCRAPRP